MPSWKSGLKTIESSPGTIEPGLARERSQIRVTASRLDSNPKTCQMSTYRRTESVISSKIFVGNLNFGTTDQELRELFGEIGEVVDVHIPKDRESGRPRGFAFIRFAAEEHAAQAVEKFHGREVGGRELRLDIAEDRPRPPRQPRDFGPPPDRFARSEYDHGGGYDRGSGGGGDGRSFDRPKKPKGSRRGLRGKKRSL